MNCIILLRFFLFSFLSGKYICDIYLSMLDFISLCKFNNIFINPQPPNDASWRFSRTALVLAAFWSVLLAFRKKTRFIKLCTKFQVKQAKFLPSKFTSLLLRRKSVQGNCLHFFKHLKKTVLALRVNKIKKEIQ